MDATTVKRRNFLAGLWAAGAAGCLQPEGGVAPAPAPQPPPQTPVSADAWERVRAEFVLSASWIHLGGFLLASHPRPVREAIERHRRALDDNPVFYLEDHDHETAVHEAAARYMGARPEEIALTDSTTMGLGVLYAGLPLRAGDDVLTTTHDHYATHESLRLAAGRAGATVRKVPLYERASTVTAGAMADAIGKAIQPATRVVAITWIHSGTGVRTPVRAIADVVAGANAGRAPKDRVLLCVDGVHGFGVEDATMADLGCDFFAAGCHKWLFGPRGPRHREGEDRRAHPRAQPPVQGGPRRDEARDLAHAARGRRVRRPRHVRGRGDGTEGGGGAAARAARDRHRHALCNEVRAPRARAPELAGRRGGGSARGPRARVALPSRPAGGRPW
jgi:hypothetical protein